MKKSLFFGLAAVSLLLVSTGQQVKAEGEGEISLYRLYNPNTGEHFYTSSGGEALHLMTVGWNFEGLGWVTSEQGQEVYRLYNQNSGDHHYTLSSNERDTLVQLGWKYEGVSWQSAGSLPLYRLYNPNAKRAGSHHYTLSSKERDALVKEGWVDEGIAWNAVSDVSGPIVAEVPLSSSEKENVLALAASLVGVRGGDVEHLKLIKEYNQVEPKPINYTVKTKDDWCDIFVTVIFQRAGLTDLIGRECGVDRHIQIFKKLGIWNEDGTATPEVGDIITFNWDKDGQPNDEFADHIGIVEKVEDGKIYTIEGNSKNVVKRNVYPIGQGNIRGFAHPEYAN